MIRRTIWSDKAGAAAVETAFVLPVFLVLLNFIGVAYPTGLKLAFILSIWLAGCGAYLFVKDQWGVAPGLAAGAAYLFAPYLAYDILFRGNLAETAAFIWKALEEGRSDAEIVQALVRDFDVTAKTAEASVARFVDSLSQRGLVRGRGRIAD